MVNQADIKEHMQVIGTDGIVVGIVDRLEGGTYSIKLARDLDEHVHHWIALASIKRVDAKGVHLKTDAHTAQATWQSSPPVPVTNVSR